MFAIKIPYNDVLRKNGLSTLDMLYHYYVQYFLRNVEFELINLVPCSSDLWRGLG